jgi:hypothetical protein
MDSNGHNGGTGNGGEDHALEILTIPGAKKDSIAPSESAARHSLKEFSPLDFLLLLSGAKVYLSKPWIKVLNYFLLTILLIAYIAYGILHVFFPKPGKLISLPNLLPYIEFFFSLIFLFLVIKRRNEIASEIRTSLSILSGKQKRILKKHALGSAAAVLLLFAIGGGAKAYQIITSDAVRTGKGFDPVRFWKGPILYYTSINNWFVTGICIYVFYVKLVRFMEENYFTELEAKLDDQIGKNNHKLIMERRQLTLRGEELIQTFSFLPLLFFSYLFIASSCLLIEIIGRDEPPLNKFIRMLPLIYKIIAIFYMISACDNCTNETADDTDRLILKIMNTDESIADREFLVRELERNAERNFTAWKMFSIDRNLMLAFSNSLISFTVLVIQLTEEKPDAPSGPKSS